MNEPRHVCAATFPTILCHRSISDFIERLTRMRRMIACACVVVMAAASFVALPRAAVAAQRGRGGPAGGARPAMARPAAPMARPAAPMARPAAPMARPQMPQMQRPQMQARPQMRLPWHVKTVVLFRFHTVNQVAKVIILPLILEVAAALDVSKK